MSELHILLVYIMLLSLFLYCRVTKHINDKKRDYIIYKDLHTYPNIDKIVHKVKNNHKKINIGVSIGGHVGAHSSGIVASAF